MFDEEDIYAAQAVESALNEKYENSKIRITKKDLPVMKETLEEAEGYIDDEYPG